MFGEARITLKRRRRARADVRVKVLLEVGLRVLLIQRLGCVLCRSILIFSSSALVGTGSPAFFMSSRLLLKVFPDSGERIRRRRHPLFRRAFADGLNSRSIDSTRPKLIIIGHRDLDVQPLLEHRCLALSS